MVLNDNNKSHINDNNANDNNKSHIKDNLSGNITGNEFLWNLYINFILDHKIWYIILLISMLTIPIQKIIIPTYYGDIINQIQKRSMNKAQYTLCIILGFWLLFSCFAIIKSYIIQTLWPRFANYCREELVRVIISKYSNNYESVKSGLIQAKINDIPWVLDSTFNIVQEILFKSLMLILSTIIYLYYLDLRLVGVFLIGCTLLGIISYYYITTTVPYVHRTEDAYQDYSEEINEVLSNLINIYTNNKEEYSIERLYSVASSACQDFLTIRNINTIYKVLYYAVSLCLFMGLLIVGLSLYKSDTLSSSQLVGLFVVAYTLLGSIIMFYFDAKEIIYNKGSMDVISKWFDSMPINANTSNTSNNYNNTNTSNNTLTTSDKYKYKYKNGINDNLDIIIDNLWFRYCNGASGGHKNRCSNTDDKWIYNGLSLQFKEGQHTVVTGHIGSGKSTFAKLLIRLYNLDEENGKGRILLGGRDISQWDTSEIRRLISYTPQKTTLFNDTLWNNIKYGLSNNKYPKSKNVTPKIVLDTLRRAGLVAVADIFEKLMHKSVGKLGSRLSGGQQQIIWILRAMFNDSRWILMDEPTNNLDPESIEYVKRMIREIQTTHGKTTIIITHDGALLELGERHVKFMNGNIASDTTK